MISTIQERIYSSKSDAGVSLTELVVYVGLFAIVSIIAGSVFFTYFEGEKAVQGIAQATNSGQVVSHSLVNGIQSASEIAINPVSAGGSQFVVAKVGSATSGSSDWTCRAWYFSETGEAYTRASTSAISEPTTDLTGWSLLASDLDTSTTYVSPQLTFGETSSTNIAINFQVLFDEGNDSVNFTSKVAKRVQNSGDSLICF